MSETSPYLRDLRSCFAVSTASPLGPITLVWGATEACHQTPDPRTHLYLLELYFDDHEPQYLNPFLQQELKRQKEDSAWQTALHRHPEIKQALLWLEQYFAGQKPEVELPEFVTFSTPFELKVWQGITTIEYGTTISYGELAQQLFPEQGKNMARAVGRAAGNNPIALMIPCHRVIGANGKLTGYAYGLERKRKLLELEAQACATKRK